MSISQQEDKNAIDDWIARNFTPPYRCAHPDHHTIDTMAGCSRWVEIDGQRRLEITCPSCKSVSFLAIPPEDLAS